MGNSVRPAHVPMCLNTAGYPGISSGWDPERVPPSIFSPLRIVQDQDVGGPSVDQEDPPKNPWKPDDELLAEIKSGDAWKSLMDMIDVSKPNMEAGDLAKSEEDTDAFSSDEVQNTNPVNKDALKSNLHILKEKTGFPYTFCKKALESNDNDLEKAEQWLEKESKELGLEKLRKIDDRKSPEGLVGIAWEKHHAAMVEMNSETDFVSSHDRFHALVNLVARTCLRHAKETNPEPKALSHVTLKGDEIGKLVADDKESLSDHLTKMIALMGERLRLRRAALISTEKSARLAVLTHASEPSEYKDQGRLGTVLVYKVTRDVDVDNESSLQLARHVCQHIIAMKPKSLETSEGVTPDAALLTQKYIHDPGQTVAEVTLKAGLKVEHFVRFERGEPGDDPDDLGTQPAKPLC